MTAAESLISRYNHFSGQPIELSTLKNFRAKVERHLDGESHGPYVPQLRDICQRVTKAIKEMISQGADGALSAVIEPVELKKKVTVVVPANPTAEFKKLEKTITRRLDAIELKVNKITKPVKEVKEEVQADLGFTQEGQSKIYDVVTAMILKEINKEGLFWRKPWSVKRVNNVSTLAQNFKTKTVYTGINYWTTNFIARSYGYNSPFFLSIQQANDLKGTVKKGAKLWPILFYTFLYVMEKPVRRKLTEEEYRALSASERADVRTFPVVQYYNVVNAEDIEGVTFPQVTEGPKIPEAQKIESCEKIIAGMPKRPPINHGGDSAHYSPGSDKIQMPPMNSFGKEQEYYCTLFHEAVHSTGHPSRIGRKFGKKFGDKDYAFEELIAELGASYLCAESGTLYFTLKNSAAYLKGWSRDLKAFLKADGKFFVQAAAGAQKASNFILNVDADEAAEGVVVKDSVIKIEKPEKKSENKTSDDQKVHAPVAGIKKGTGTYQVKELGKKFFVIYKFNDGEEMLMSKHYNTKKGAEKRLVSVKRQAGVSESTTEPQPKLNGILSGADIGKMNFTKLELTGPWKHDLGNHIYTDNQLMFWGEPGSGKTVYILKLAKYLASELNLPVLYVANEELGRSTFTEKINEFDIHHANLSFVKDVKGVDLSKYRVIIMDSVNSLRMSLEDYIAFHDDNPDKMYVLVVQSTKDGDFRGGKDWEHEMDFAGEIVNRKLIVRKNRLDPGFNKKRQELLIDEQVKKVEEKNLIKEKVKAKVVSPVTVPSTPPPNQIAA